jgi:hypothetical protein
MSVDTTRSQYKYVYYGSEDVPVILLAKMYDKDGKLVRELHASRLKKASSIWGARHVEMRCRGKNPHGADHRRC